MQQVKDEKVGQPIVIVRSLQAKGAWRWYWFGY
jgi:hypothetical protein